MTTHAQEVRVFLAELLVVCRKHNMILGHEDSQGAFLIEDLTPDGVKWIQAASDKRANAPLLINGDQHKRRDGQCKACWKDYPRVHEGCGGGLYHASFDEQLTMDSYSLKFECDKCGDTTP